MLPIAIEPPEVGLQLRGDLRDLALEEVAEVLPARRIILDPVAHAILCEGRVVIVAPIDQGEICTALDLPRTQFSEERRDDIMLTFCMIGSDDPWWTA